MNRILGLDVGDRRIGIAISDELGLTSRGLFTLKRTNIKTDTQKILDIVRENNCSIVIVGLPLNISGEDSLQTKKVRFFAEKLLNKFLSNSLGWVRVELFDERYSTKNAEDILDEMRVSEVKKKMVIDQQAAALILDEWLLENRGSND
jgi:putative Holliday junction resolvase